MPGTEGTADQMRRQGFTLPEVLLATAIMTIVMAQAATTLVASHRLLEATAADIELTFQTRALREKLLYDISEGEGGLMNACLDELTIQNKNPKGKGNGLRFKPKRGGGNNRLEVGSNKKIKADRGKAGWLSRTPLVFQTETIFESVTNDNGMVILNLDLALLIADRTYTQRNQTVVQIMNP